MPRRDFAVAGKITVFEQDALYCSKNREMTTAQKRLARIKIGDC
jgi:hypothetical protein